MVVSALRSMRCCSASLRVPLLSCHRRANPVAGSPLSYSAAVSASLRALHSGRPRLAQAHALTPRLCKQQPRAIATAPLAPPPALAPPLRQASTFYCSPQIDRAGHLRTDVAWLQGAMKAQDTLVLFRGPDPLSTTVLADVQ